MSRIRSIGVLVFTAIAIPLAGCGGQPALEVDLPAQDQARWVMPLDEYQGASASALPSYAENLLIAECLGENSIDWPIAWQPTDDASYLAPPANMSGFPALTVELAQESGYRANFAPGDMGAPTAESMDRQRAFNAIAASTPGFDPIFDSCLGEARTHVPTEEVTGSSNRLIGWVNEAGEAARRAPDVAKADAAWQECLQSAGYNSVPTSPLGSDESMPTQALRDELGIPNRWGSGDGAPENPLTVQEIDLAVDDATCRESSGWTAAIYNASWDAQADLVVEHADALIRIRDEWQSAHEKILAVIASHAPSQ